VLDPFALSEVDFEQRLADEALDGLKILLVEDNPVNQELARRLLEKDAHG
jgi:protein-histidine pros-kinase